MPGALFHLAPPSADIYDAALEGLVRENEVLISRGSAPASLYSTGARYRTEPHEVWRHAADVAREKWGDCEDLAAYRAAELRISGEDPDARVVTYQTGRRRYHAVVARGSGLLEDPSRALGMKLPANASPPTDLEGIAMRENYFGSNVSGEADIMVGEDPGTTMDVTFDIYRHGRGWSGILRIPLGDGKAAFIKTSTTPAPKVQSDDSVVKSKAATIEKMQNAATAVINNPVVKAALPPQVSTALTVLSSPQAKQAVSAVKNVGGKAVSAIRSIF